ncbi:WD40 repeat domain-containing protein [Ancylobacter pratisalsi]|uniref:WD40 repeat domain-containing protein n=1 Tax=Ancylobacter pratisalsi TaxID=1745854 RepID=A0A6P1YJY9_9HYPH|nr:WD40 repeat domain-containing protein [Ancylobacter pratisalsi]QIB33280.1 WD40 repeat domain-containing protein [Ancylobacter pratisalsi]
MTALSSSPSSMPSSITSKLQPLDLGDGVVGAGFLGTRAVFALGSREIVLAGETVERVAAHNGAILSVSSDARRILTGGDDGRVVATAGDGSTQTLFEQKGRWIDQVAAGPDGSVAFSVGKTAHFQPLKGERRTLDLPSTVGGLAFAPKGTRLAIAHYGGATLWFPNAQAKPEVLAWKGSHRGVLWHPDGRFVITTMQEPALHGWRLADGANMRMSGYPARVNFMSFTSGGRFLATSGSNEAILWPFATKEGPMGKQPTMLAPRDMRVSCVAAHPKDEVFACGYDDGLVLLVRVSDGAEILARAPAGGPVSALAWRADGGALAIGTQEGVGGLIVL